MNILSLFDGISCGQVALNRLGIKYNKYYASEIDKYAIQITQKNYPETIQLGDINNWENWEIEKPDLIMGGSPCFVAGTKVITNKGYKNIEDIKVGDLVLTHKKRFKKVLNISNKPQEKNIWEVKIQGCLVTETTGNHPYYVREMKRIWNNKKRTCERSFDDPIWKSVKNLNASNDYVALPIISFEENPRNLNEEICWLFGRYVADGYYQDSIRLNRKNSFVYKIVICVGKHKTEDFEKNIKTLNYTKTEDRTVFKYCFNSKYLLTLLKDIDLGRGAKNKKISQEILNLPIYLAEQFLKGYMSGDGSFYKGKFKATSISKELCMGLNLLVAKIYKVNSGLSFTQRSKTTMIEGRIVNQNNTYTIDFYTEMKKQSHAKFIDGFIWLPVKKILNTKEKSLVYNLEVEEDNSYTANNIVVHNCQGFSFAGKQLNFDDPRSKLFFKFVDILKYFKPKYFLLENVKMKKEYQDVISECLGVDPIEINSSLVSAQNRKRLYWTNIPNVTSPKDKGILLKDIIHEYSEVDRDKSLCIDANYYKGGNLKQYYEKSRRQLVFEYLEEYIVPFDKTLQILDKEIQRGKVGYFRKDSQANRVYYIHDKAITLCGEAGGGAAKMGQYLFGCITPDRINKRQNGQKFNEGNKFYTLTAQDRHGILIEGYIRKLTPIECERLQTLPDDYTKGISNTQRYKCLGNGWTVDIICHILKEINKEQT